MGIITKEFSREVMKRLKMRNNFLKKKTEETRKFYLKQRNKWEKVFKNGTSQRQPLKKFKEYGLLKAHDTPSNFLKAVFHKFDLVHS